MTRSRRTPIIDRNVLIKDMDSGQWRSADIEYEPVPERILVLAELLQEALDARCQELEEDPSVQKRKYH